MLFPPAEKNGAAPKHVNNQRQSRKAIRLILGKNLSLKQVFFLVFRKQLSSEILINSSAENVWAIITDFPSYPNWNPFIRRLTGEIKGRL
jgi:hypothetical protein